MNDDDLRELDEVLDLDPGDPRRTRAMESARLRNLLREWEEFESGAGEVTSDRLAEALERLAEQAHQIAAAPAGANPHTVHRRSPNRRRSATTWRAISLVAGLALLVGIGAQVMTPVESGMNTRLRNGGWNGENTITITLTRDGSTLVLDWSGNAEFAQADSALVIFYGPDLKELGRESVAPTPPVRVDLDPAASRQPMGVRLLLRSGDRELARTPLRSVPSN